MLEQSRPNYYAVIPAVLRYSPYVKMGAKLLYGEITALANKEGYCWASNAYFSNLYGVSAKQVSVWVQELKSYGFVKVVIDKSTGNLRKIYLTDSYPTEFYQTDDHPMNQKVDTYIPKGVDPIHQKVIHNNTSISNTNNNTMSVSQANSTNKKKEEDFIQELHTILGGTRPLKSLDTYRKQLKTRLKTFSLEEIREATTKLSYNEYMMGDSDRNSVKYGTVEYILRKDSHVDKWLQVEAQPVRTTNGRTKVNLDEINWEEV